MINLKEKRESLPSSPGIYLMKDSLGNIIYVGKSKNLKSRVNSYFQNSKHQSPKVEKLVKNLKDFEYILTDTEFEAFMLECKLIKEIKPAYNRLMKSSNCYIYIKIKKDAKYPDFELSREKHDEDDNLYLGPYTNRNKAELAIEGLKKHCKILCNNSSKNCRACLNYSIGLCIGMYLDNISQHLYMARFDKILNVLKGKDNILLQEMESAMNMAAEKFDFEIAAKYRDYINAINSLANKSDMLNFVKHNKNILLHEYLDDTIFKLFLINGNKVLFSEKYDIQHSDLQELKDQLKSKILFYFNPKKHNSGIKIGSEEIDEAQIIYSYIKSNTNDCRHIIIRKKWLGSSYNKDFDTALDKLFSK